MPRYPGILYYAETILKHKQLNHESQPPNHD